MSYQEDMISRLKEENSELYIKLENFMWESEKHKLEKEELEEERTKLQKLEDSWYSDNERRLSIENRELKKKNKELEETIARLDRYLLKRSS